MEKSFSRKAAIIISYLPDKSNPKNQNLCLFTGVVILEAVAMIYFSAFNECPMIESIYYKGTPEQRSLMGISSGNDNVSTDNAHDYSTVQPNMTAPLSY